MTDLRRSQCSRNPRGTRTNDYEWWGAVVQNQLLLTVEQAAEQLGVSRTTVYGLIKDGRIEAVRVGRSRRVPNEALTAYVTSLREPRS